MAAPPGIARTQTSGEMSAGPGGSTTGQLALTERELPQQEHADLGLIDNDNTPDMRKAPAATEALRKNDHHIRITEQEI